MPAVSALWRWTSHPRVRRFFSGCRWLHIYLSTALFSLLLFFAVTGVVLNHPDWLDSKDAQQGVETYPLPDGIRHQLQASGSPDTASLEAHIEVLTGLTSPKEVSIDREFNEVTLDYPLPAGYAFVVVSAETVSIDVEYRRGSLLALWNDLHKGRHSGAVWGLLIDGSAILMVFFALTGLVILLQNPRFRGRGLLVVALGAITPWLIYVLAVPSLR